MARLSVTQTRASVSAARAAGISPTAYALLAELALEGWLTNGRLAERLGMSTGGVTPALDTLVAKGYAERTPNRADGRSSIVSVTAAGREILDRSAWSLGPEL